MKEYYFRTAATMKPYNNKKWWIDSGIVRPLTIEAETIETALKQYQNALKEKYCIYISNNALKNKDPMYIDGANGETIQRGFVITGSTEFNNDYINRTKQYIDLWVDVDILTSAF